MRFRFFFANAAFAAAMLWAAPALASPSARTGASAEISAPAGIGVIGSLRTQSALTLQLTGRPGDAVSLAVPGSIATSNAAGEQLSLTTLTPHMVSGGMVLPQDVVTVSIGLLLPEGAAASGTYGGVTLVLAQYN